MADRSPIEEHARKVSRAILGLYARVCPGMAYVDDLQALDGIREAVEPLLPPLRPPVVQGYLVKADSGRWAVQTGSSGQWEITSGDAFEYNHGDGWRRTRMEHAPGGYYAVDGATLHQGLPARIPQHY